MSYTVNYEFNLKLKESIKEQNFSNLIDKHLGLRECFGYSFNLDNKELTFGYWNNFDEEENEELLHSIAPFLDSNSSIVCFGEDNESWKYILTDGEWIEHQGVYIYTDDDLIREVKERGLVLV